MASRSIIVMLEPDQGSVRRFRGQVAGNAAARLTASQIPPPFARRFDSRTFPGMVILERP